MELDINDFIVDGCISHLVMTEMPLAVDAFGMEICKTMVDLFIADYSIEHVTNEATNISVTLTRNDKSSLFMRASKPLPFLDPRPLSKPIVISSS